MSDDIVVRYAQSEENRNRLRAFLVATSSEQASHTLDAHLARPRYRPEFTLLASISGELVGCALVAHRRLRLGVVMFDCGLLELLHVPSGHSSQAIFEALLGAYLGMLYEEDFPIAALRGPLSRYGPAGFAPYLFQSRITLATQHAAPCAAHFAPNELRPADESDLEDLAALYEASYAGLPLAEMRTFPDWRAMLASRDELLVLADAAGRTLAFARLAPDAGSAAHALVVAEAAAAHVGAARRLLESLADLAGGRGLPALLLVPPGHMVAQGALQRGAELRLTAAPRAEEVVLPLAGVVSLTAALETLAPELARRLAGSRYTGWSGSLRMEIDAVRATLMFRAGHLTVVDGTRPADVRLRRMTLRALTQLLLGYRAAADLRADGELDCDDIALGLVDSLFPALGACESV